MKGERGGGRKRAEGKGPTHSCAVKSSLHVFHTGHVPTQDLFPPTRPIVCSMTHQFCIRGHVLVSVVVSLELLIGHELQSSVRCAEKTRNKTLATQVCAPLVTLSWRSYSRMF